MNRVFPQGVRARMPFVSVGLTVLMACLAASPVALASVSQYTQAGDAGAETGDWGGANGAVVGPPDGSCANMGAVGKVNLVSNFGFSLPNDAVIDDITVYAKAGENDEQTVGIQLATDATIDPPDTAGDQKSLTVFDGPNGNCSSTAVTTVGGSLAFWGTNSGVINASAVNSTSFGLVLSKLETSSVKVDAICIKILYSTETGSSSTEECFPPPPPDENDITVVKEVIGTPPGDDWDFESKDLSDFSLPAEGGFKVFDDLQVGEFTIEEVAKEGYAVTSECLSEDVVIASGGSSITVELEEEGQDATCVFTNTFLSPSPPVNRATFTVQKLFSDGNSDQDVVISIQCFTGLPLNQSKTVHPDNGGEFEVKFVVESFDQGELDCNVFEEPVTGYSGSYDATTYVIGTASEDDEGCHFDDIDTSEAGDTDPQHLCEIVNDPDPVEVTVTKDWVIEGSGGDELDTGYKLKLVCDAEIPGGHECGGNMVVAGDDYGYCEEGTWSKVFYNKSGDDDETYTAEVIPDWDGGTDCWVHEQVFDDSVEVDNGCGDSSNPGVHVEIAAGSGCTITNTVFYEGIPTLSQYGLAILAIVMLGVGAVGFRRFV